MFSTAGPIALLSALIACGSSIGDQTKIVAGRDDLIRESTLGSAASVVIDHFKVPVGMLLGTTAVHCVFDTQIKERGLEEVLRSLTRECPAYQWSFSHGVVHVEPADDRDSLAHVELNRFVARRKTAYQAWDALRLRAEVRSWMRAHRFQEHTVINEPSAFASSQLKFSFRLEGVTVGTVLDSIITAAHLPMWRISERMVGGERVISIEL